MRSRFNKFIATNPWLKLASLILAIVIWFFVVSKGRSVVTIDIPIEFKNISTMLEVVNRPKKVHISIEGQERFFKDLREEDLSVVIDLSGIRKGKISFPLSAESIALPKSLAVTKISPRTIDLLVEEKVKKSVPVRAIIIGSPAAGFLIKTIKVVPKMVKIEGPESMIAKIYTVKTEPIDITGIASGFHYSAHLNAGKENIMMHTSEVEVSIVVGRKAK